MSAPAARIHPASDEETADEETADEETADEELTASREEDAEEEPLTLSVPAVPLSPLPDV